MTTGATIWPPTRAHRAAHQAGRGAPQRPAWRRSRPSRAGARRRCRTPSHPRDGRWPPSATGWPTRSRSIPPRRGQPGLAEEPRRPPQPRPRRPRPGRDLRGPHGRPAGPRPLGRPLPRAPGYRTRGHGVSGPRRAPLSASSSASRSGPCPRGGPAAGLRSWAPPLVFAFAVLRVLFVVGLARSSSWSRLSPTGTRGRDPLRAENGAAPRSPTRSGTPRTGPWAGRTVSRPARRSPARPAACTRATAGGE